MLLLMLCLGLGLLGATCSCPKEDIQQFYGSLLEAFARDRLTDVPALRGEIERGDDPYVGHYRACYDGYSGAEWLFGGHKTERAGHGEINLLCRLVIDTGQARLVLHKGDAEQVLMDAGGLYYTSYKLDSSKQYLCLEAEDFCGELHLECR